MVPTGRLSADFFDLSTGFAGELLRKSTNYGVRIAILGGVTMHVARSDAFDALVWEANRGNHVWFVADQAEPDRRLVPK